MKKDISIPRPVSEAAEQVAQKLGMSLSELYTVAIVAYIATHREGDVTELLNRVYEEESSTLEPEMVSLQVASLGGEVW